MTSWIKVITEPLGLAGFALFLVFSFLGRNRQKKRPSWLAPSAYAMAALALLGGITLAYHNSNNQVPALSSSAPSQSQNIGDIQQDVRGEGANVAGVQGNVSVSIGKAESQPAITPLTQEQLGHLLAAKASSDIVTSEIERRGIAFKMTPELAQKFRADGASDSVVEVLNRKTAQ